MGASEFGGSNRCRTSTKLTDQLKNSYENGKPAQAATSSCKKTGIFRFQIVSEVPGLKDKIQINNNDASTP